MTLGVEVTEQELKALLEVGFLHRERGEADQARQVFEGVLALRPDLAVAKVGLANALQLAGDDAGAEKALREAAGSQPDNAFVQQQLGECLHTLGDTLGRGPVEIGDKRLFTGAVQRELFSHR